MREKPKEKGPVIKRDEHNQLDKNDADRVINQLGKELIETERDFQKDNAMKNAIGDKRDVIVKIIIYQRNTKDGHVVLADSANPLFEKFNDNQLDPLRYRYFDHIDMEIMSKEIPMSMATVGKFMMGGFRALTNYLCKMNVFNNV